MSYTLEACSFLKTNLIIYTSVSSDTLHSAVFTPLSIIIDIIQPHFPSNAPHSGRTFRKKAREASQEGTHSSLPPRPSNFIFSLSSSCSPDLYPPLLDISNRREKEKALTCLRETTRGNQTASARRKIRLNFERKTLSRKTFVCSLAACVYAHETFMTNARCLSAQARSCT